MITTEKTEKKRKGGPHFASRKTVCGVELIPLIEVAKILGVTPSTLYSRKNRGILDLDFKTVMIHNKYYVRKDDFDAYLRRIGLPTNY